MRRLRHWLEYGALRGVLEPLSRCPPSLADRAAACVGWMLFQIVRVRRRVVEPQIAAAYPDASRGWVRRLARATYVHVVREAVATIAFSRQGPQALAGDVEVRGLEPLRRAAQRGGALVVTGHFGNWELSAASLAAAGVKIYGVFRPQRNVPLDRYLRRVRERLGIRLVTRAEVARSARAILGQGGVLGFVADQHAADRRVVVPFLGRPAFTHRGPAALALALRVPLFVGALRRVGPGRRYLCEIEEVSVPPASPATEASREPAARDDAVRALTARWTAHFERFVRLSPEQYYWHHRRWKAAPPSSPAKEESRTTGARRMGPERREP